MLFAATSLSKAGVSPIGVQLHRRGQSPFKIAALEEFFVSLPAARPLCLSIVYRSCLSDSFILAPLEDWRHYKNNLQKSTAVFCCILPVLCSPLLLLFMPDLFDFRVGGVTVQ